MLVTISFLRSAKVDGNGNTLPIGHIPTGASLSQAAAGAFAAAPADTTIARIATDTAITINGVGTSDLMPAGTVEYFPCHNGKIFTTALA